MMPVQGQKTSLGFEVLFGLSQFMLRRILVQDSVSVLVQLFVTDNSIIDGQTIEQ